LLCESQYSQILRLVSDIHIKYQQLFSNLPLHILLRF